MELFKWERDVVPSIGPRPHEVVDSQTPTYDVYLGVMSARFGTPSGEYGSGTEAEFRAALERRNGAGKPWITFYFDENPKVGRSPDERQQWDQVCKFRDELERIGIVGTFNGVRGSRDAFFEKVGENLRAIAHELKVPALPSGVTHYLQRLADETKHLTLLGMGRSLQVELPIETAFIPLQSTVVRSLELKPTERPRDGGDRDDIELTDVFRETARRKMRGIIVLGEPGSGKTTGARQIAWRLSGGGARSEELGLPAGLVPVLLRLRNLSRAALDETAPLVGLKKFLDEETCCHGAPDGLERPGAALWNGQAGDLLWILDGLDEVVDSAARRRVSGWLQSAISQRPRDWFLVTCRFQGYFREGVPLGPKFAQFDVRPLSDEKIEQFVRAWFKAACDKLHGAGSTAETKAHADSDQLLGILNLPTYQLGHIRELCTNPLLLTILCILFHEERKLPTGRAELYSHCVRVLLEYWRRDLYATDLGTTLKPYDAEAAQAVLARIAWWLHQEEQRIAAPLADLQAEAARGLATVSPTSGLGHDGAAFVERMRTETGVLAMTGDGSGSCGFLHLSFQEYLAADHAARENLAHELATRATDSWWREVALLSLRRSRPYCEAFFREMLAAGIAEEHADLANRCLQEAMYFAAEPFVDELSRTTSTRRRVAILTLLRDRVEQVPELAQLCVELAKSADFETRGMASEILIRVGVTPPKSAGRQPLDVIVDERIGVTLVAIPPGEFQMGSNKGDGDEKPVHQVRLTRGFYLGKYPVTNAEYRRYWEEVSAQGTKIAEPMYWGDRRFNQPEQPVVGVSWDEAAAYCQWAGGRLPTEAEWEYACRAGSTTEFCFGDDEGDLADYAWYGKNSGGQPQPVGGKKPNGWGVHDMHGNVFEWCGDWHSTYEARLQTDPRGGWYCVNRVNRGGSWLDTAGDCRSAYRSRNTPGYRYDYLGFRLALVESRS